ncbi:MAG: hypothetical protein GY790_10495 [Bacteroidetes bacterium]|nr:hypothetical protein [Bacteroidota bacterium]
MSKASFHNTIKRDKKTGIQTIVLGGDLSIRNAVAIQKKLNAVKYTGDVISIQLKNVENLDITIVQMVYSLTNTLAGQDKIFEINSELPEDLEKVLANAGFREMI